jgi:hypothetical protein
MNTNYYAVPPQDDPHIVENTAPETEYEQVPASKLSGGGLIDRPKKDDLKDLSLYKTDDFSCIIL